jgi:hypothetical protein
MKKLFYIIPLFLCILACGMQPQTRQAVAEMVNATLTAIAQNNPPVMVTPTSTAPNEGAPALSRDILQNAVYRSPDWGEFQLSNGIYHRTPLTSQESPETYTTSLLDSVLYGDLNDDQVEDAVVFLATQNGGTGHFVEMAAVLNLNGEARNVSTLYLGDRVIVESGAIQGGTIQLTMRVQGPNDGACCPSQLVTWNFHLDDGKLVQIP